MGKGVLGRIIVKILENCPTKQAFENLGCEHETSSRELEFYRSHLPCSQRLVIRRKELWVILFKSLPYNLNKSGVYTVWARFQDGLSLFKSEKTLYAGLN